MAISKKQINLNLLTGDFLFKKKDKRDSSENSEERPEVVNKEALA